MHWNSRKIKQIKGRQAPIRLPQLVTQRCFEMKLNLGAWDLTRSDSMLKKARRVFSLPSNLKKVSSGREGDERSGDRIGYGGLKSKVSEVGREL